MHGGAPQRVGWEWIRGVCVLNGRNPNKKRGENSRGNNTVEQLREVSREVIGHRERAAGDHQRWAAPKVLGKPEDVGVGVGAEAGAEAGVGVGVGMVVRVGGREDGDGWATESDRKQAEDGWVGHSIGSHASKHRSVCNKQVHHVKVRAHAAQRGRRFNMNILRPHHDYFRHYWTSRCRSSTAFGRASGPTWSTRSKRQAYVAASMVADMMITFIHGA